MKQQRSLPILIAAFALVLGAGVFGGMLAARLPGADAVDSAGVAGQSPLAHELQLTPPQREQMRQIWEGVRRTAEDCFEDGRRMQRNRDAALEQLLNDEQKAKFEKISKEYADEFEKVKRRRAQAFREAVESTNRILSPEQR